MDATGTQDVHASRMDLLRGALRAWHPHGPWTEEIVADPILTDLESHFDAVLARLAAEAGWMPARTAAPKRILGHWDGVDTGIRQLMRTEPLETTRSQYKGQEITVPTYAETLRIKGILILKRNQRRDYLDFAALAHGLSLEDLCVAMKSFDCLYPQDNGHAPLQQLGASWAIPARPDVTAWIGNGVTYVCPEGSIEIRCACCLETAAWLWENLMPPAEADEDRRPQVSVTCALEAKQGLWNVVSERCAPRQHTAFQRPVLVHSPSGSSGTHRKRMHKAVSVSKSDRKNPNAPVTRAMVIT